ncbi:MAG: cyclic nucleotide-binding domain-containing protein [Acidobacteriota bacterium]
MAKVRVGGTLDRKVEEFVQRFPAGAEIFCEGDPGCEMFIIQSGQVAISRRVGSQVRQLAILEKGDFFGEMAVLEEYPERSATACALTEVEVLQLRGTDLEALLKRRPTVSLRMMAKLSERLRESNRRLEELSGERDVHAAFAPIPTSQGIETWALLYHEPSGRAFPLRAVGDTSLGRHDPVTGVTPDVDLNALDPDRAVSRRHATIRSAEGGLTITETNAASNGTFLNGTKLEAFQPYPLAPGDIVQLALVSMRLQVLTPPG